MFHLQTFLDENSYKTFCTEIENLKCHIVFAPILIVVKNSTTILEPYYIKLIFWNIFQKNSQM